MIDQMNGTEAPAPTQEQMAQVNAMFAKMAPHFKAVIGNMTNGLLASCPGVQPHVILQMICFEVAHTAGSALQGDIATLAGIRKGFRDAFEEGLRKAPIVAPGNTMMPSPGLRRS